MTIDHLSYSSLSTYTSCPRSYYLSRVKQAESMPAWYFVVGSSVHTFIQQYLSPAPAEGIEVDVEQFFMAEVEKQMEIEPDTSKWLHGGSKDAPVVEERALKLAQDCAERAILFLEDVDVWHVEYDATGYLPGCTLPIKAYIDLIGEHKKHGPVIADWKTGKTKPKDNLQLETYNSLLYYPSPEWMTRMIGQTFTGLWVMLNPDAPQARPVKFKHTPESLGKLYGGVEEQLKKKIARPEPQFNCQFCTMKPNCITQSGSNDRTRYYDTPIKDGWLPF